MAPVKELRRMAATIASEQPPVVELDYSGKYCRHGTLAPCIGAHQPGSWCPSCEECSCKIFASDEPPCRERGCPGMCVECVDTVCPPKSDTSEAE